MGFRINTNIAAMDAHRNAMMTNQGLDKSLGSLSSGLRINKAADDASGMTIADSLRSQAQGLGQAINNANDGVAVVQTADGALDEYIKIINSVRTKSIQAASDGQNADSRGAIQNDITRLLQEANNIAKTTQFNGQKLLDGTFTNKSFHIGAYAAETVDLSVGNVQTSAVGDIKGMSGTATHVAFTTATDLSEGATGFALNANNLTVNDIDVSPSINNLSPLKLTDAAGVASAITNATGLVAGATNSFIAAGAVTAGSINDTNYLKINGVNVADTTVLGSDSNGALVNAINAITAETGVTATLNTDKKLVLESVDGRNISISNNSTVVAQIDTLTVAMTPGTLTGDTLSWGDGAVNVSALLTSSDTLTSGTAKLAALINGLSDYGASSAAGVITITGLATGAAFSGSFSATIGNATAVETTPTAASGLAADLASAVTGLTADNLTNGSSSANVATLASAATAAVTIAKGDLVINGVDLAGTYGDGSTADSARAGLEAKIQGITGMSESTITAATGKLELAVNNGDDLNVAGATANSTFKLTTGVTNQSKIGSVQVYSDTAVKVAGTTLDAFGFTAGTKAVADQGLSLDTIDVTSRDSAEKAILISDSALKQLDATRSDLGSVQNQLESTIRNISVTQVNVTSAESQIRDVDFASESANFAKLNILAQSGSYAMSQANAVQQNVMRLLQ